MRLLPSSSRRRETSLVCLGPTALAGSCIQTECLAWFGFLSRRLWNPFEGMVAWGGRGFFSFVLFFLSSAGNLLLCGLVGGLGLGSLVCMCCLWLSVDRLGMGCMMVVVLVSLCRCLVVRFGIVHGKWLGVVFPGRLGLRQVVSSGILVGSVLL